MKKYLIFLIVICSILSLFFLVKGYDKLNNYRYEPKKTWINKNAYVGGDAYNYIINSNIATGYFVLTMFFGLSAVGTGIILAIKENNPNLKNSSDG